MIYDEELNFVIVNKLIQKKSYFKLFYLNLISAEIYNYLMLQNTSVVTFNYYEIQNNIRRINPIMLRHNILSYYIDFSFACM